MDRIKDYSIEHLETFRILTQFSRCWGVIDSHLRANRKLESIMVLCVEGSEFLSKIGLAEEILKKIKE